jgi:hypothetical protein
MATNINNGKDQKMNDRIYHGNTCHATTHPIPTERTANLFCGICKDWFWPYAEHPNMRQLRSTPVRDLTQEQCRKLLVHHHGGTLTDERRRAYLFKHCEHPEAYFSSEAEREQIKASIAAGI